MQIAIPIINKLVEIKIGKSKRMVTICVRPNTSMIPMMPPMMQRNADSNRNSISITPLFAPPL
jgi:hypothetical protein